MAIRHSALSIVHIIILFITPLLLLDTPITIILFLNPLFLLDTHITKSYL